MPQTNPNLPSKQPLKDASFSEEPFATPILDWQTMAPAPSQSFYQVALYAYRKSEDRRSRRLSKIKAKISDKNQNELIHEKMERGCLVLREWPRKRFSQVWSRDSQMNPSEIVLELHDVVQGEMRAHLTTIFGELKYERLREAARKQLEIKARD